MAVLPTTYFTDYAPIVSEPAMGERERRALIVWQKAKLLKELGGNDYPGVRGIVSTVGANDASIAPLLVRARRAILPKPSGLGAALYSALQTIQLAATNPQTSRLTARQQLQGLDMLSAEDIAICEIYLDAAFYASALSVVTET